MTQVTCSNCGFIIEYGIMNAPTACPKCGCVVSFDGIGGVR